MVMKVVSYPMEGATGERLPVVPGAEFVVAEDRGHFNAYFAPTSDRWISLYRVAPGRFLVTNVVGSGLRRHIPDGVGWRAFLRTVAGRKHRWFRATGTDADGPFIGRRMRLSADAPATDATEGEPWTDGDVTITSARPTLPSRCGTTRAQLRAIEEDTDE